MGLVKRTVAALSGIATVVGRQVAYRRNCESRLLKQKYGSNVLMLIAGLITFFYK